MASLEYLGWSDLSDDRIKKCQLCKGWGHLGSVPVPICAVCKKNKVPITNDGGSIYSCGCGDTVKAQKCTKCDVSDKKFKQDTSYHYYGKEPVHPWGSCPNVN